MFTNLIESTSHAREFKRRGSFVLFTMATYGVLFVITGVVSIYAYDARLDQQNYEDIVFLSPQDLIPAQPQVTTTTPTERPRDTRDNESRIPVREIAMATVDTPERPPDNISTTPNKNLPLPPGPVKIGGPDYTPPGPGGGPGSGGSGGRQIVSQSQIVAIEEPPPAPEPPKAPPKIVSKGVITSQALVLPKPAYPPLAKQAGIQGTVSVQVLIDESGRVISAKAISGSPFLTAEAQKAALQAKFSPTLLGEQPVKVSGVITYNFILGR